MLGREFKKVANAEDTVKLWSYRLNRGIALREKEEKLWDSNEKYVEMKERNTIARTSDAWALDDFCANLCGDWLDQRVASTMFTRPQFILNPESEEASQFVEVPEVGSQQTRRVYRYTVTQAILNKVFKKIDAEQNIWTGVQAAQQALASWKIGCEKEYEFIDPKKPKFNEDGMLNPEIYVYDVDTGEPALDDLGEPIMRPELMKPVYEQYFWDWAPYRQMIFDPDGENDFSQHSWVAFEYVIPLKEAKANKLFSNTKYLRGTGHIKDDKERMKPKGGGSEDPIIKRDEECVRLVEIWHMDEDMYYVLAEGHHKMLRKARISEEFPGVYPCPYVFYRARQRTGEFYCRPPLTDLVPLNESYDRMRQWENAAARRTARKVLADSSIVGAEEADQLESDRDMEVILLDKENLPFEQVLRVLESPPPPVEVFRNTEKLAQEFERIGGQPGGLPKSETATESKLIAGYDSIKIEFQRRLLGKALIQGGKKLLDSLQANLTMGQAVQLEDEGGEMFLGFIKDRSVIIGDYDVDIDIEEMAPQDKNLRAANSISAAGMMGQNPWLFTSKAFVEYILHNLGVRNPVVVDEIVEAANAQVQMVQMQAQAAVAAKQQQGAPPGAVADEAQGAMEHRDDAGMMEGIY